MLDKATPPTLSLGLDDPSESFDLWSDAGYEIIEAKRRESRENELAKRKPRTYTQVQATQLIGRSESFLKGKGLNDAWSDSGLPRYTLKRINELRDKTGTRYRKPENVKPLTIALAKLKGGVGNSTICVHLAHYLATQGLKVLIVDLDLQASASGLAAGVNPDVDFDKEDTVYEILRDAPMDFPSIVRYTYFENVLLAPCNSVMQNLEFELVEQIQKDRSEWPKDENGKPISVYNRLSEGLKTIENEFDIILLDCPPALGTITINALTAADAMINTVRPNPLDRTSFAVFNSSLASLYESVPKPLRYYRILINQMDRSRASELEENTIREIYGSYVLKNTVVESSEIKGAPSLMSTLFDLEKPVKSSNANRRAVDSMSRTFDEILTDIKELWEMEAEDNG